MTDHPEVPYNVRRTDPPAFDPRGDRQVDPHKWDFEAAYGRLVFRGKGILVGCLVFGTILLGSIWYLGLRQETVLTRALTSTAVEHSTLSESAQQTNCILAMLPEERIQFRNDSRPDAWSRWCWWIQRKSGGPQF